MSKKIKENVYSSPLETFLNYCQEVRGSYKQNFDTVGECDKVTVDFNHALELLTLDYGERAKLATSQAKNFKTRRKSKDVTEGLLPMYQFLSDPVNLTFIKKLEEALGATRKVEQIHKTRHYNFRTRNTTCAVGDKLDLFDKASSDKSKKESEVKNTPTEAVADLQDTVKDVSTNKVKREKPLTPKNCISKEKMTSFLKKILDEKKTANENRKLLAKEKRKKKDALESKP